MELPTGVYWVTAALMGTAAIFFIISTVVLAVALKKMHSKHPLFGMYEYIITTLSGSLAASIHVLLILAFVPQQYRLTLETVYIGAIMVGGISLMLFSIKLKIFMDRGGY